MTDARRKRRLDELLVQRGLCDSRSRARALIMAGRVRLGDHRLDKPGKEYPEDTPVHLDQPPPYVSRGGEKLAGLLDEVSLPVRDAHVLDVGASTGGFTDCLLQRGAASATCIDVGRGQLHGRIAADPRVSSLERLNARHLRPGLLPRETYDIVVMDLSFISLRQVLPAVWPFLRAEGWLAALVKPQFEAGREEATRGGGIISDPVIHERVRREIRAFATSELPGAEVLAETVSPLKGTDGNREFFLVLQRRPEKTRHDPALAPWDKGSS